MKIEQIYTDCLAEAAYYIESNGEVAIVDPLRETQPYLDKATENGAKIKYIFETHFHADFVSGHVDLAKKTGAKIIYGPTAKTGYDIIEATDGQEFKVGDVTIKVLHTPGHTLESSTFLVIDENGKEHGIITGDTLFIGDVGRPDLAIKSNLTREDLAEMLFDSLRNKIMPLPDDIIVYPAHGAGSSCGKNMSSETKDTLGNQKATNYALRADMTKAEFLKEVLTGILPAPQYFPKNAMMNKSGYKEIGEVMTQGNTALSIFEFQELSKQEDVLVLDVRTEQEFISAHIPNSIFIGLNGSFALWVGALIVDLNQKIILITPEGKEKEAVLRLARVGYDNVLGYLKGGINVWKIAGNELDDIEAITPAEFEETLNSTSAILDVRKPSEYNAEHVENAKSFPLDYINDNLNTMNDDSSYFIHCKSGYRSVIACSIMKRNGIHDIVNVEGGFDQIVKTNVTITDFICPSTL
ncbi:MAG: MBL fold metallo-hydrolase [Flavobacteriales bacterium]|nr:MBL fold metallo-hydrolase [Flavobacteriales bacterium]